MTVAFVPTPLSDAEFLALAHAVFSVVEDAVDRWLQDDVVDIDSHRAGGLLELSLPDGSKLVVNTQPPLHEIWLAARSGGYHFKYADGQWRDTRDGRNFFDTISASVSEQAGIPLRFGPPY